MARIFDRSTQTMKFMFASQRYTNLFLISLTGIIWFVLLGYRDLIDPDEGFYAEVAREMLTSGDWVTPRIDGYKFFDKPPLQYWTSAISMALFGENNASARLWCSGLGFIGALWVWLLGNRLYNYQAGRYAFLILISSFLYVGLGHVNVLDMGVSVFLAITLGAFALAQWARNSTTGWQRWMLLSWAAAAGAVLSKGLIGIVFPVAAIVLYSLWQRDWTLWRHLLVGRGLLLFLLLVMPWFVLVSRANDQFLQYFFIHEHFQRFTSTIHRRDHPWWYFIVVLSVGFLPWIITILQAIVNPSFSWKATDAGKFNPSRLFWVYAVFIVMFFSSSHSKLPPYILPVFPFLALLAGEKLAQKKQAFNAIIMTGLLAIGVAVAAWNIVSFAGQRTPEFIFLAYRPWLIAAFIALAVACLIAFKYRKSTDVSIMTIAIGSLLAFQLAGWGFQSFAPVRSGRKLAEAIQAYDQQKKLKIYAINEFEYSLLYYLKRNIALVGYEGNMKFGISREPEKWIPDQATFMPLWLNVMPSLAIMSRSTYEDWQSRQIPMNIVYQDPRRLVVRKP